MTRLLGGTAVLFLFAMMLLTFIDVWGRAFLYPVMGGFEITEIMLATLIFCGLPLMTLAEEHITVDLFDRFIPKRILPIRDGVISLISGGMISVVCYQLWLRWEETVAYGDTTAILLIPLSPLTFFMFIMTGLTAIVFFFLAWAKLFSKN
jgi:TRAP-type C4-dicarboxylate transport system permease small subunit|tara:strand:+ start:1538 stop:1987 length:450 start_codon:yes stop_codon:yes gene_type:complete